MRVGIAWATMMPDTALRIVPLDDVWRDWAHAQLEAWGMLLVVTRGELYDLTDSPGLVALRGEEPVGMLTYRLDGAACEVMSLESMVENIGAGTALLEAVAEIAREVGCRRLWLITTNDNLHAVGFYQRRGFHIAAIHVNAVAQSRKLKPQIPLMGMDGIPLRDEIEMARDL